MSESSSASERRSYSVTRSILPFFSGAWARPWPSSRIAPASRANAHAASRAPRFRAPRALAALCWQNRRWAVAGIALVGRGGYRRADARRSLAQRSRAGQVLGLLSPAGHAGAHELQLDGGGTWRDSW